MAGDKLEFNGKVTAARGNGMFLVEVEEDQPTQSDKRTVVFCTLSGKIRQNNIRILEGDKVKIEVSVYDLNKGRIIYRDKLNTKTS